MAEGIEQDRLSDGLGVGKESNRTPVFGWSSWVEGRETYWRSKVEYFSQVLHFGHKFEMPVRQSSGDIRQTLVHLYLEFREANCWSQVEKEPELEPVRSGNQEKLGTTEKKVFQERASGQVCQML